MKPGVCFVGGGRYKQPLDSEHAAKFRELSGLGEIFVVAYSADTMPRRFRESAEFYLLPDVSPAVLRYGLMCTLGGWIAAYLVLRRAVTVIVAQSPYEGVVAVSVKLIARLIGRRIAVVVESHGNFETDLFLQRSVKFVVLYRRLMAWAARFALNRADVLRAISSSTRRQLEAHVSGKPLVEFPTWTDIEVFLGSDSCEGRDHDDPVILYVGVLIPRKGVHLLLEAFEKLADEFPHARLFIIGEAEDREYASGIRLRSARGKAADRVVFSSPLSQKELAKHMAKARALVLPSISEGLGRVVFEAMACGTPVIGARVGGIPDLIEDGVNGFLFEPNDVAGLTRHLRWVLDYPEECSLMGRRARVFVRDFFSTERYRACYAEVFRMATDGVDARVGSA